MKRTIVWLLTMALFLTMLAGCRTEDKTDQTPSTDKESATTTTTATPDPTETIYFNEVGDFTVAGRTLTENVAVNREDFCIPNTEQITTYLSGTLYTIEYLLNYPIDPDTFAIISARTQPNYGWIQLIDENGEVVFVLNISEQDYAHDTYPHIVTPRSSRIGGQEVTLFEGVKWGHSLYRYGEFQIDDLYIVCATYDKSRTELVGFINDILSATSHSEDHLASHITVTSGETAIRPYSRVTWQRIDNGDGTYEEMIADHCDPVSLFIDQADAIPTLMIKDSISYSVQANGMVEAVYLYSPVGDTYATKATTWETLAKLPNGTYYVMLAVLLDGNCDPDAPQNSYRYEDFFRLVVDKPNKQEGVIYPTVQLHPLYQKYPEYFGLDGMKGVEVYVWQMAGNLYHCGALTGTNRLKTEEEIQRLFNNGATLEEMRTILELCEIERERVSIIPVRNPLSSFWYEIDIEYAKQINALFWGE